MIIGFPAQVNQRQHGEPRKQRKPPGVRALRHLQRAAAEHVRPRGGDRREAGGYDSNDLRLTTQIDEVMISL